jgi:hypothetical protein
MTTPNDHNLPPAPTRGCPVSAATFDLLISAARKGGWPAVFKVFAEGEETNEPRPGGYIVKRPARRRTLEQFLTKRPDLKALIDSAAQERRDRLLSSLEDEAERIALGPGDITQDFGKNGQVTRTRIDVRNKLYCILQLLKAHNPEQYADRKRIDVAGRVDHTHSLGESPTTYRITSEDVLSLEPDEQDQLFTLLDRLESVRQEKKHGNERQIIDAPARLLESSPEPPETPSSQQPRD